MELENKTIIVTGASSGIGPRRRGCSQGKTRTSFSAHGDPRNWRPLRMRSVAVALTPYSLPAT